MKQGKKALSLLAVVAFLVMALVPMTALAADGDGLAAKIGGNDTATVNLGAIVAATPDTQTITVSQTDSASSSVAVTLAITGTSNGAYFDTAGTTTKSVTISSGQTSATADLTIPSTATAGTIIVTPSYNSTNGSPVTITAYKVTIDTATATVGLENNIACTLEPTVAGATYEWALDEGDDGSTGATFTTDDANPAVLTATDTGTAKVKVTVKDAEGNTLATGTRDITIQLPTPTVTLAIDPSSIDIDGTATVTATLANIPEGASIEWTSSAPSFATIAPTDPSDGNLSAGATSATATVTGVAGGTSNITATITYTDGTSKTVDSAPVSVTVAAAQTDSAQIAVSPATSTLTAGQDVTLTWSTEGVTTPATIEWTVDNDGVTITPAQSTVGSPSDTGRIVVAVPAAASAGSVTITGTLSGSTKTCTAVISVVAAEPTAAPTASAEPSSSAVPSASATPGQSSTSPGTAVPVPTLRPGTSVQPSTAPSASASTAPSASPSESATTVPSSVPSGSAGPGPSASAAPPISLTPDASDAPADLTVTENLDGSGSILSGVPISDPDKTTDVETLTTWVSVPEDATVQVLDADGQPAVLSGPVGTGMTIEVISADGSVLRSTVVVVKGDVTGSGEMNLTQLVRMAAAYVGTNPLTGVYEEAADLNGDGSITLTDLVIEAQMFRAAGLTMQA